MSKGIKVSDQVYQELDLLRAKRVTFSDVVEGLLKMRLKAMELMNVLEGQLRYGGQQRDQSDPLRQATLERADLEQRTLKSEESESAPVNP